MLTSEELVIQAAQAYPPDKLARMQRSRINNALQQKQRQAWNRAEGGVVLLSVIAWYVSFVIVALGISLFTGINDIFLGTLVFGCLPALVPTLLSLPSAERRVKQRVEQSFQPPLSTTRLETRLVSNEGVDRLTTYLYVDGTNTILESVPVDIADEATVALAARMQARDEEAVPGLTMWREHPTNLAIPSHAKTPQTISREHRETIKGILSLNKVEIHSLDHISAPPATGYVILVAEHVDHSSYNVI